MALIPPFPCSSSIPSNKNPNLPRSTHSLPAMANLLRFSSSLVIPQHQFPSKAIISFQTSSTLKLLPFLQLGSPGSLLRTCSNQSLLFKTASANQQSTSAALDISKPEPEETQNEIQQDPDEFDRTKLLAENIPWTCTSSDIHNLFAQFGTVTDVQLSMHNRTRNRGLAFISFASEEEARVAFDKLDSYEFEGRLIRVKFAKKQKKIAPIVTDLSKTYNVFVGNLSWGVRSSHLRDFFAAANSNLLSAEVIFQNNPRKSTGYGFVSFGSMEDAKAAIAAFDGKELMGRPIRLGLGKIQPNRSGEESVDSSISEGTSKEANGGGLSESDKLEEASKEASNAGGQESKQYVE